MVSFSDAVCGQLTFACQSHMQHKLLKFQNFKNFQNSNLKRNSIVLLFHGTHPKDLRLGKKNFGFFFSNLIMILIHDHDPNS